MEHLKRKIETEKEDNQERMTCSLINGERLSVRFAEKPETDLVINFTQSETKLIKKVICGSRDC